MFETELRIHDILVWIRIRGSMPLTNGSGSGFGSGSCNFRHWPSRCQEKTNFFCLLHNFLKIKSQKESQNIRNQDFSNFSGSILLNNGSGSGRPETESGSATLVRKLQCMIPMHRNCISSNKYNRKTS